MLASIPIPLVPKIVSKNIISQQPIIISPASSKKDQNKLPPPPPPPPKKAQSKGAPPSSPLALKVSSKDKLPPIYESDKLPSLPPPELIAEDKKEGNENEN